MEDHERVYSRLRLGPRGTADPGSDRQEWLGTTWGPHALHAGRRPARQSVVHTAPTPPLTSTDAYSHVLGVKRVAAGEMTEAVLGDRFRFPLPPSPLPTMLGIRRIAWWGHPTGVRTAPLDMLTALAVVAKTNSSMTGAIAKSTISSFREAGVRPADRLEFTTFHNFIDLDNGFDHRKRQIVVVSESKKTTCILGETSSVEWPSAANSVERIE